MGAVVAALAVFLAVESGTPVAQIGSDFVLDGGVLVANWGCARAACRGGAESRGWRLLTATAVVWALANAIWTVYGLSRNHVYPFQSFADIGFVGCAVPLVVRLVSFPPQGERPVSRPRAALDASVVSVLGIRQRWGARLSWVILGGGLLTLALTDSIYVKRTVDGAVTSGTLLYTGWLVAFFLVALASLVAGRTVVEVEHFERDVDRLLVAPEPATVTLPPPSRVDSRASWSRFNHSRP